MATTYPEDEFDRLAAERKTIGAHRQPPSGRPWIIAIVAVLVLAPLVGIGASKLFMGSDSPQVATTAPAQQSSSSAEVTSGPSAEPTDPATAAETSAAPTEAPSATPTEAPVVSKPNLGTRVLVLNGRGTAGFAGEKSAILQGAGFTNLNVADYKGGAEPAESTVYYSGADHEGTAKAAAEALGFANVVEDSAVTGQYGASVVVVAR